MLFVYCIVEFRNDVSQWTTIVAKGYAAIHATCCLCLNLFFLKRNIKFFVIVNPFFRISFLWQLSAKFHKTSWLTHLRQPPYCYYFLVFFLTIPLCNLPALL